MIISSYFPVANTALSSITTAETRNVAFSVYIPIALTLGVGVTPSLMGRLGEAGLFSEGFVGLGLLTLASLGLLPLLRVKKRRAG
jgi:hypothetical protein